MNSKWGKYILLMLFLIFLGLYFSSQAGLIDYQAKYKNSMTEKQIKQFEEDIKNNVEVDIKDYINTNDKKYSNTVSRLTLKISNTIGKIVKSIIDLIFDGLESAMNR